jgi:hypothetical protein
MRQSDLNRAVAQATGEIVETISRLGFQHVIVPVPRVRTRFSMRRRHRRKPSLRLSA